MRPILILAAGALAACQLTAPTSTAPTTPAGSVPIGPECTGPGPGNFNGARLTSEVIAKIPRQFAEDRTLLTEVLAGRGTEEQIKFATLCHGLTV